MTDSPTGTWANPSWGEPGGQPGRPAGPDNSAGQPGAPHIAPPPPGAPPGYPPPPPPPGSPGAGYGAYGWQPDTTPKPGVVPLRPLGVGEVLDGALTTVRRHPKITIGLAALVVTVQQVISVVTQAYTGSLSGAFGPDAALGPAGASPFAALGSVPGLVLLGVNLLLGLVLGALLTGALMVVVGQSVLGRPVALADVWQQVKPRFWALLGGSVLAGLLPFAGVLLAVVIGVIIGFATSAVTGVIVGVILGLLLLIPGSYVWGVLSLTTAAITLEKLGPIKGLRRSFQLARRDFWRVWGLQVLAILIAQFLAGFLTLPFTVVGFVVLLTGGGEEPSPLRFLISLIVIAMGGIVAGSVTEPFLSAVTGLVYIDRRMRGEGFDISLQETARTTRVHQPTGSGPPAGWL